MSMTSENSVSSSTMAESGERRPTPPQDPRVSASNTKKMTDPYGPSQRATKTSTSTRKVS